MKYLKTYTACPTCGQALELSPGAETEIDTALARVRGAVQEADREVSLLHDLVHASTVATAADYDACVWRMHDALRAALEGRG